MRLCQYQPEDKSLIEFFRKKENKWAAIGTGIIWTGIVILMAAMPGFKYEQKYKTIEITLQDIPRKQEKKIQRVTETEKQAVTEKSSSPASSAAPSAPSAAGKKTQEKPAQTKSTPKTETTKTSAKKSASQQTSAPEVRKSIEEQMAEMQQAKKQKKDVDWAAMFDDEEEQTSSAVLPPAKTKALDNALSGSSATSDSSGGGAAASSSANGKSYSTKASDSTSNALKNVMTAKTYSSNANGVSSTVVASSASVNGQVSVAMSDGSARVLIQPKELNIRLSDRAAASIDATKTVTISFTVTADGHVPVNSIKIYPASILGTIVQNEVTDQISKFLFSSANTEGTAKFDYTIKKN